MRFALLIVAAVGAVARADTTAKQVEDRLQGVLWSDAHHEEGEKPVKHPPPRVALDGHGARTDLKEGDVVGAAEFALARPVPVLVAVAIDGKSAWAASNLGAPMPAGDKQDIDGHVLALFDAPAPWTPVMTHVGLQTKAFEVGTSKGAVPKLTDKVEDGAADAVKRFKATIGDPAAFAKSVSDRKDVTLFGSEPAERYAGGAKVREQLAKWKLAFAVRDGVAAGVTASKTVAWVAAVVDARKADKPKSAATVYLVSAIYEKHGSSWDVVALQFSNPTPQ